MTERLLQLQARADQQLREFAVDLGRTPDYPVDEPSRRRVKDYPCLYIYGRKDKGLAKLPRRGKAVIDYRLKRTTVTTDEHGADSHSGDIEIRSIDPIIKGKKKELSAMERLQELQSRAADQLQEFDGRARDGAGRYARGNEPAKADDFRQAMSKKKRKRALIGGALAAGAIGAGAAVPGGRKAVSRVAGAAMRSITG